MGIYIHRNAFPPEFPENDKSKIEDYAVQIADVVENAASELYRIDKFSDSTTVKFQQWYKAASDFLNNVSPHRLISACYGYAVEEYVNLKIASGTPSVPVGYKVRLQVTHGNTRPDIVILKADGTEIAWLDITNQSSLGHIFYKAGNWQNGRSFIAELLYPNFALSKIERGSGSIASRVIALSIVRQAAERKQLFMQHLAHKMNAVLRELTERIRREEIIYKADVAECVERHFGVFFSDNYKHPIIKSMLKLYIGCSVAYHRADACNCLSGLYGEVRQDKSAAMSYIEESCNALNPYIFY